MAALWDADLGLRNPMGKFDSFSGCQINEDVHSYHDVSCKKGVTYYEKTSND